MEKDNEAVKQLFAVYSLSDDKYDAYANLTVSSEHEFATLATALVQLVMESEDFAKVWYAAATNLEKIKGLFKEEQKPIN